MTPTVGCLFLHGFTSSMDCVAPLVPMAARLGLPYRQPVLRGHDADPQQLRGVTWRDWYADALAAFRDLRREVDQVVICGLSMGGLVGLHLAAAHAHEVAGVVSIASALRFVDPMTKLSPLLARFIPMFPIDPRRAFTDPTRGAQSTNYRQFATDAFVSLYRYRPVIEALLPTLRAPLLVLHSHRDRVIQPSAAQSIYDLAGSAHKTLRWFEESGHEMLLDLEGDAVVAVIEQFIVALPALQPAATL